MSDDNRDRTETPPTRRGVLEAAGAGSLAGAVATLFSEGALGATRPTEPNGAGGPFAETPTVDESIYPQSVASGGPTTDGVILWTRIDPMAYDENRSLGIEVATDSAFDDNGVDAFEGSVAFRGAVGPDAFGPDTDYTVNVDLAGELAADRFYRYRFVYDGAASRVGRCRTLPEPDAEKESLRLALASCNQYLQGYYGAYDHIADEDADFLVHLGDFVYETAGDGFTDERGIDLPSGNRQAWTLADFRTLHRTYRGDEFMQRALRNHTFVWTWDDHEIVNNRWWNYDEDAPETRSHPKGDDPAFMRKLYLRGIRALMEFIPVRARFDPDVTEAESSREGFRLYRSVQFGDLAELFMTDERLYRTPPPEDAAGQRDVGLPPSREVRDPDRFVLGSEQRDWLIDGMAESTATWSVWGNEVLQSAWKYANADEASLYLNYDAWDGYEHERRLIMGELDRRNVDNLVTLTGDMHSWVVAYLQKDYRSAEKQYEPAPDTEDNRVGVEFMTPAISSISLREIVIDDRPELEPEDEVVEAGMESQNPHMEWFKWSEHGYATVEFTPERFEYAAYRVDRRVDPSEERPEKELLRRYGVPEGEVTIRQLGGQQLGMSGSGDAG